MSDGSRFEKIVGRLPMGIDSVVGSGMSWFISRLDPDGVKFAKYNNGFAIEVKGIPDDKINEAESFWDEYVEPSLSGD